MSEKLYPIGVFWDIENLNVPKYKSASTVVNRIRERFFKGFREAEFMCVCDINKENKDVIQELNSAQVNIVHIDATGKNAADDKIRQSLRRFSDTHPPHTRIILISGDFNFISDLSDLRHRNNYYTILIHGRFTNETLINCANESHVYDDIIDTLPFRTPSKGPEGKAEIEIRGFCKDTPQKQLHTKLKMLSSNCGGRVISLTPDYAILRFTTRDTAIKASKRMNGEKIFGFKITASFPGEKTHVDASQDIPCKLKYQKDFEYRHLNKGQYSKTCGTSSVPIDIPSAGYKIFHNDNRPEPDPSCIASNYFATPENEDSLSIDNLPNPKCNRSLLMLQQQHYQEPKTEQSDMYSSYYRDYRSCSAPTWHSPSFVYPHTGGSPQSYYRNSPSPNRYSVYSPSTLNSYQYQNCNHSNYYGSSSPNRLLSNTFQPISNGYINSGSGSPSDCNGMEGPVELVVSNLDYNISAKEWRKILFTTFHPQVKVLSVHIKTQPDNTCIGMIKIPTVDEARFAISQFHRKKIGYKRIQVTLKQDDSHIAAVNLRMEVIALLTEATGNVLPLFKFIELFDKRFRKNISLSELYKLKDIVEIYEHSGTGRFVCLVQNPQITRVFTPVSDASDMEIQEILEPSVCAQHCPDGSVFYSEAMNCFMLPNIKLHLKPFSANVHTLLLSHNGSLPLASFTACYAAEFSPLVAVKESGVPLEHLISCIPGVEIILNKAGMKKVQWSKNPTSPSPYDSPINGACTMSPTLLQVSQDIVDLLINSPHCRIPVSKFIPAYHHHYSRQCRVADYGYTKLSELFDVISHSVQVLGIGGRRLLSLSHKAQVHRFTADLLQVLKCSPGKLVDLEDFSASFVRVFGLPWDVTQYGLCYLEDLVHELSPSHITIYKEADRTYISIPRKAVTEEIEKTKQFAAEVYELLKYNQYRITFNKFIPAYHHHFGRQCKVADYGFNKLSDLFEAISNVVEIEAECEEKILKLTLPEMRKVLSEQVTNMLKQRPGQCIPLHELMPAFMIQFGFTPRFEDFNVECLKSLLSKLRHIIKVEVYNGEQFVVLLRHTQLPPLALQVLQLLMDQSSGCLPLVELCSWYQTTFNVDCDMKRIREELIDYVQVSGDDNSAVISLTPLQTLARDIRLLLIGFGKIPLNQLEFQFQETFGADISPNKYGFPSLQALLYALPHIVTVRGKGAKKVLQLSKQLKVPSALQQAAVLLTGSKTLVPNMNGKHDSDTPSNDSGVTDTHEEDLLNEERPISVPSPIDLLCGGIPSTIPSPQLYPSANQILPDLMSFTSNRDQDYLMITEDEKRQLRTPLCQTPTSQILQLAAQYLPETKEGSHIPPPSHSPSPPNFGHHSHRASPVPILGQKSYRENETSPVMRLLQGTLTRQPPVASKSVHTLNNDSVRSGSKSASPVPMKLFQYSQSLTKQEKCSSDIQHRSVVKSDPLDVLQCAQDKSEFGELLKGGWWKASQTQLEEVNKTFHLSESRTTSPSTSRSNRSSPTVKNTLKLSLEAKSQKPEKIATAQEAVPKSLKLAQPLANGQVPQIVSDLDTTLDQSFDTTLDSEMSYNLLFKRGHPLDTSSVKSNTPRTSPRKARRPRLAAKFNIPIQPTSSQYDA